MLKMTAKIAFKHVVRRSIILMGHFPVASDDSKGSVLAIFAICILMLIGVVGLAVDGSRLFLMHSKLQGAVDAAGLSAAAQYSTTNVNVQVSKFAAANFLGAGVDATINSVTVTSSADEQILTIVAEASTPATFMKIFGYTVVSTSATSEITRAGKGGIELSLVLDVTGSMETSNKIGSLRTCTAIMRQTNCCISASFLFRKV
jgi:Flp pilus assembly protein TadG